MKKLVYLILTVMGFVIFVNVTTIDKTQTIKIESDRGSLEINPLY